MTIPETSPKEQPETSPFARNVDALCAAGYGKFLHGIVPPGLPILAGGAPTSGKEPGLWSNKRWVLLSDWPNYLMSTVDIERLMRGRDAGIGMNCGEVCALDLDFYASRGEARDTQRVLRNLILEAVAELMGIDVKALPIRTRQGSNSCMVFFRVAEPTYKRSLKFIIEGEDSNIDLMGMGQQVVVAAHHKSGAEVTTTLARTPFAELPVLDAALIDALWIEIGKRVERLHGVIKANQVGNSHAGDRETEEYTEPYFKTYFTRQIERKIMQWRDAWLRRLGFPHHKTGTKEVTRAYKEDLMRDLEEDLAFYPDGIYDYGSRRRHTVISLLCEFCSIDDEGELRFYPPAHYRQDSKLEVECWRVVNDHARRPSEAEALAWFCRTLCEREEELNFPANATWEKDALPMLSRQLLGLEWGAVQEAWVSHWFVDEDGTVWNPSQWGADQVRQQVGMLPAMRAVMPTQFATWRVEWERQGVDDVEALIEAETQRVQETAANDNAGVGASANTRTAEINWPEPMDLFGDGDETPLQDIEKGVLPAVLYDYAHDAASRMGVSPVMTIVAGLASLAAAIGSKYRIQPHREDPTWTRACIFWGLISAPPGSKKSPVINMMTSPLAQLNGEWHARDSYTRLLMAAQRKRLGKSAGVMIEIETPIRRCMTENFTIEAMHRILGDNYFGVLIRVPELTSLIYSMDAYKTTKGGDRGDLLNLADGGRLSVDRAGTGARNIDYWGASVIAGVQDDKIREMAPSLGVDGMLQRFIPVDGGGSRPQSRLKPDEKAGVEWQRVVREIAELHQTDPMRFLLPEEVLDKQDDPLRTALEAQRSMLRSTFGVDRFFRYPVIQLSVEADREWSALHDEFINLQGLPGMSGAWANHLSKWDGFAASLLLLMHVVERWGKVPEEEEVSADTAQRCMELVHWLLRHSMQFYGKNIGAGNAAGDARRVIGWLLSNDGKAAQCREAGIVTRHQAGMALGQDNPAKEGARNATAMTLLARLGWCMPDEQQMPDQHGPRRWYMNPRMFDGRFMDLVKREKERRTAAVERLSRAREQKRKLERDQEGDLEG